jgi:hypothetical protein
VIVRFAVATLPAASVARTVTFALTFSPSSSALRISRPLRLLREKQLQGRRLTRPQIGARRLELVLLDLRQLPLPA